MAIEIPYELPGVERATLQLKNIREEYTANQRAVIDLATKTEKGKEAFDKLVEGFAAGTISAKEMRDSLSKLADQAPRTAREAKQLSDVQEKELARTAREAAKAALDHARALKEQEKAEKEAYEARLREARGLEDANRKTREAAAEFIRLAAATEKAADEAREAARPWNVADRAVRAFGEGAKAFWESSSRFGEAYRNIREPLADITEGLVHAAERTAHLAAEQGRLERVQSSLGVSLSRSQEYAGGFAAQTEIATSALTLMGQGVRVSQQELDALARLSMRRASDTGRDLHDVLENLTESVTEGGEELGKVSPALLAVADSSHSAGERLAAMVVEAEKLGPATRDAATDFARYTEAVETSQRQLSAGFVEELTHLDNLSGKTRDARDAADDWNTSMRAVGATFAYLGSAALNGVGAIAGTIATAIATVPALLTGAGNAFREFTNADNLRRGVAGERAGAAFNAAMNNETLTSLTDFVEARVAALNALVEDQDTSRTSATPGAAPTAGDLARDRRLRGASNNALGGQAENTRPDMTFSRDETGLFPGQRRRGRQRATLAQLMDRAGGRNGLPFEGESSPDLAVVTEEGTFTEAADLAQEVENQHGKSAAQAAVDAAAFANSDTTRFRDRQTERAVEREQQEQDQRLERMRSFTDRWRDLHTEQVDVTAQAMESIAGLIEEGGGAIGGAWEQIVTGQKSVSDAFQDGLTDFLKGVAKRESVEGGVELGKGASALAGIVTAPLAPGHFAAAAVHFGIAAAAGGASMLTARAPPATSGGGGASSGPRERPLPTNAQNPDRAGGGNVINLTFGGGVVMGTPRELAAEIGNVLNDPTNGFTLNPRRLG